MNILGISGLDKSVSFKKAQFPGLSSRDYRIVQGLDSAAALVTRDGVQAAAAEERFSREKGTNAFPGAAIRYCLQAANLQPSQVDRIAHGFAYEPYRDLYGVTAALKNEFEEVLSEDAQLHCLYQLFPEVDWRARFVAVPHHLAHAASAFYPSGFEEALVLITDGMGEATSTTVLVASKDGLKVVFENNGLHSLGMLYGLFTLHLGFVMGMDEYKVMGLAPYGDPKKYGQKVLDLIEFKPNASYTVPIVYKNNTPRESATYEVSRQLLTEMFGPPREPESPLSQRTMDLAAGIQYALRESLLRILGHHKSATGQKNLCMAGGVALNCSANGAILRSGLFDKVFVQPAAGDDGTALGAALYVQSVQDGGGRVGKRMELPLWGPEYPTEVVRESVMTANCELRSYESFVEVAAETARALADGKIVAWFQGRMEFGPRALGSRSILADARGADMRERINRIVKKREEFRPFAPVVKAEAGASIFEMEPGAEETFAHMLFVTQVRPEFQKQLPAITHVDGSARVQTVFKRNNERLWTLLDAFERITGLPVVLNTSFNVRGQPIVCTPREAVETFLSVELDLLVIDRFIVRKKHS
jgi:carbamoyltransferase